MEEYKILKEYEEAKQNGTLPEMPEELEAKCRDLIDEAFGSARRRARVKRIGTAVAKAAMVVLILLGLSTVTVLSVDAFRVPVLNFLIDESGKYGTVVIGGDTSQDSSTPDSVQEWFEAVIPVGYQLDSRYIFSSQESITYSNDEGHILCLIIEYGENDTNVDTEDLEFVPVEFGDYSAVFWEKNGYHLMWLDSDNQVIYHLWASHLTETDFWHLAYALIV